MTSSKNKEKQLLIGKSKIKMSSAEAKTEQEVATRVISIISTRGEKVKVPFSGTAWADLKKILERGGTDVNGKSFSAFSLSNMKCVESINKSTLEHPQAVVPDGDFSLFLMPVKSKSGASLSRTEAYGKIKGFIEQDGDRAKAHFNSEKNYTTKSTDALNELIESYAPGTKKSVSKEKAKAISDVVTSVKEAKSEDDLIEVLDGLSNNEKLDVIIKLLAGMKTGGMTAEAKATETSIPATPVKTAEELAKEEADMKAAKEEEERKEREAAEEAERKRKEKEEKEADEKAMRELAQGFGDVRL
jgi:hypothetical protein